jgi:hypothetical protein
MKSKFLINQRILFSIVGCPKCREYARFIEEINFNLPSEKRIKVVDCTNYYDFGIIEDPLIGIFRRIKKRDGSPFLDGNFPKLVFDGGYMEGAVEKEQLKAFINALVHEEFIIEKDIPYLFYPSQISR